MQNYIKLHIFRAKVVMFVPNIIDGHKNQFANGISLIGFI
jgi:hypothetical protein